MDDFLRFVVERHRIWEKRQAGEPPPWTDDPILASRKFTNVFRVLDPGTQFVLRELADPWLEDRDQLMRLFLYRHTGRVAAWEWLDLTCGYPYLENLPDVREALKEFRGSVTTTRMKTQWAGEETVRLKPQRSVFTNAYLVFPQSHDKGTDKLDSILDLTERLFMPESPDDIMPEWEQAETQAARFKLLRRNKGVGDFMSMQILTDWGYLGAVDLEDEFLMPGPGSVKGAKALDPDARPMETVRRVVEAVRGLADCPRLGYRTPSLMDIGSNLLCEWSKYVRQTPGKPYIPAHPGPQPDPVLPAYYNEDLL